jgi:ABC-type lipoprotein release transport system permease subunit
MTAVTFTIALRSLLRRKVRMIMIGTLVFLGTLLIVFGESFSLSVRHFSRLSIISYFTGDLIVYSDRSKEPPSPFSFTTPLPVLNDPGKIEAWLSVNPMVERHVAIAQNFGLLSVEKQGRKSDLPFFFYAVDPTNYRSAFSNITVSKGAFFNTDGKGPAKGVVLSAFQIGNYAKNYSIDLAPGDAVTLLSLSDGGSVNAVPSRIIGVYEPKYYRNVFNYINFMDIATYSQLYNFTGVDGASMPSQFNNALSLESEQDIFSLANNDFGSLDTRKLVTQELNGYVMIAVKLKNHRAAAAFMADLRKSGFAVKVASWKEASGFFAYIAGIIQAVIYGATFLIFLIVVFILMNTLIIGVLERTAEIGTLRAIGAEKQFISALFLWESFMLNGTAALLGMVASLVFTITLGRNGGIALPDVFQQYLVGGGSLPLLLSPRPFIVATALIIIVSILATLYPVRVATAITPLKAMAGK